MTVPVSELQSIAPSSVIELFELELNATQHDVNETYRFHAGTSLDDNGELVWAGDTYLRFPVEADGFAYEGKGQLPRPKLRVSNILGTVTAILLTIPGGLGGAKVTRIRTLARYLDAVNFPGGTNPYGTPDPTAEFPREIYYIDRKSVETRDVVEFELAAAFDLAGVRAPKRQCIASICQWVYRSAECGYTESSFFNENDQVTTTLAQDVCGKRLSSCKVRFESFTRTGSVTTGSNQLTLASAVNSPAGTPVAGFGVPAGTTVSSVSSGGLVVTMSQNATATTTVSTTGTIQSNRTQLVVSSATGLANGMTIRGPNIASGTTIAGISGTTITLSQSVDLVYSLVKSASGQLLPLFFASFGNLLQVDTSSLSIGMIVMGPNLPSDYSVKITSVVPGLGVYITYTAPYSLAVSTYSFYTTSSYSTQTYSFAGSTTYVFRNPSNDALPFGSFPGIGTYFV